MAKASEVFVSPRGIARFPYLTSPDTKFDPEGKYRVDLELDASEREAKEFLMSLDKDVAEFSKDARRPFKRDDDSGMYIVRFGSKFKPNVFDATRNRIPDEVNVGSGSVVKVAFEKHFYPGFGGGMNLYLKAVQVIELVEYGGPGAEAFGFEDEVGPRVGDDEDNALVDDEDAIFGE